MKRRFYPIALNLTDKRCLVIGSDEEVLNKALRLAESGAKVELIWDPPPATAALESKGIQVRRRAFHLDDLSDQFLVLLSRKTDDALAADVAKKCHEKRILLAALDRPDLCDVVQLSLFDRGRLRIGISTGGASPGLARKVREGLERSLEEEPIEAFLDDLAALRERLDKEIPEFDERKRALLAAIEGFEFRAGVTFPATWLSRKKL
jgi:precorrin-2 dehydrogenase/sirohydrochlorin ferrochelatase